MLKNDTANTLMLKVMAEIGETFPKGSINLSEAQKNVVLVMGNIFNKDVDPNAAKLLNNFLINHRADKVTCMTAWALYHDYVQNLS